MRPGGGQVLVVRPPGGGHESHACPHPSAWPHSNVCMRVGLSTTLETLLLRNPLPGGYPGPYMYLGIPKLHVHVVAVYM